MADRDVSALGLASPPASAPATTYYPAASVRNLGKYPANVSGYIRQYDVSSGVLVATYQIARANLQPGATAAVASTDPLVWSPADIGKKFYFQGFATTDRDQVPSNNYFGPLTVEVTGATPPPPVIQAHAPQHANGGTDELDVEGLSGQLAEKQDPTEHASDHMNGGDDELSVAGLSGELADPQTAKGHHTTHEPGGLDPILGIPAAAHHATHETGGSDPIAGVEKTANKGAASGYCGLGTDSLVPSTNLATNEPGANQFLKADRTWDAPVSVPLPLAPFELSHQKELLGTVTGMSTQTIVTKHYHTPTPTPSGVLLLASLALGDPNQQQGNCQVDIWIEWISGGQTKKSPIAYFTKLAYDHTWERMVSFFAFAAADPPDNNTDVLLVIDNQHNDAVGWGEAQLLVLPLQ